MRQRTAATDASGAATAAATASNGDEAARAKALGREALQLQQYDKAIRLLRISDRLHPNEDTRALLKSALAGQARLDTNQQNAQRAAASAPPPWSQQDLFGRGMQRVDAALGVAWTHLPQSMQRAIERSILPSMRKPLAYVGCLIVLAAIYRLVLHGPALAFGRLPGDVYYHSGNMMVSAPLVSCLLSSLALNYVARAFRGGG